MKKKKIVVLSGAGMSAESGIATFRDSNGLWENHSIEEVATPEGFDKNPQLVLKFYNERRKQLWTVSPNSGHKDLANLEEDFEVLIITQNVDNLHERAGSKNVIHLHGELDKVRSVKNPNLILEWKKDLKIGDLAADGAQLRPYIVWFGEQVPMLEKAMEEITTADFVIVIGTSMQVYPAASLISYAPMDAPKFYVDPNPKLNMEMEVASNLEIIKEKGTIGVPIAIEMIKSIK